MKTSTIILLAVFAILVVLMIGGAYAEDNRALWVEGEFVVQFKASMPGNYAEDLISSFGCSISNKSDYLPGAYVVRPNTGAVVPGCAHSATMETDMTNFNAHPIVLKFKARPDVVAFVEPNYIRYPAYEPNDTRFAEQWGMEQIHAIEAWDVSQGDEDVLVCICDSGIKRDHPDLTNKVVDVTNTTGIGGATDVTDNVGHGTHVSGIAAADTDNGIGVAGVAFDCKILFAKVGEGWMTSFAIAAGIEWGVSKGAVAINLSLGGALPSDLEHNAIIDADSRNCWVVAASGNDSMRELGYIGPVGYPAAFEECIAVGASGPTGVVADYSNSGPELDLAAPGGDMLLEPATGGIMSTVTGEMGGAGNPEYAYAQGTSMAAPQVTGAVGLLVAAGIPREDVRTALESTAKQPGGATGQDTDDYGHGIIDLEAALASVGIGVKIIEPTAGEIVEYQTPEIICTFRNVNTNTIVLSIDGVIVISAALGNTDDYYDAVEQKLTYSPDPLGAGSHTVAVSASNLQGRSGSDSVTFLIIPHEQIGGLTLWSVPYDIDPGVEGGAYSVLAGTEYSLYWWDPEDREWRIYRSYAQPRDLEASLEPPDAGVRPEGYPDNVSTPPRGCGRFLFLNGKTQMDVLSSSIPRQAYEIDLCNGWNMIGHPFPFMVGWNVVKFSYKGQTKTLIDAVAADWIRPTLYRFVRPPGDEGGYYSWDSAPNGYLRPWEGHWLYVPAETVKSLAGGGIDPMGYPLTMTVPAATSKGRGAIAEDMDVNPHRARVNAKDDFRLQISAVCGKLADRFNYVGVTSGASNGADSLDVMDPPIPGDNISVSFVHQDWGRLSGGYAEDVRGEIGSGQIWNILVTSTVKEGRATLSWPNISQMPDGYQYLLYDADAKRTVNLRTRSNYTFAVAEDGSAKTLQLTVKADSLANLRITDVVAAPTRGGVSISYNLTRDAEVSVRVTSLNGRGLRELPAGSRGPGIGTVAWDGKDAQGRKAARGMYMFEVIARGDDGRIVRAVAPGRVR